MVKTNFPPLLPDDSQLGPAMSALTAKQRAFVAGVLSGKTQVDAYIGAGYGSGTSERKVAGINASRLAHTEKVQAAIREVGAASVGAKIPEWLAMCEHIARDTTQAAPARLKALNMLLTYGGMISDKKVVKHEHSLSDEQLHTRLHQLSAELGLDPREVLKRAGYTDAQFEEVSLAEVALMAPSKPEGEPDPEVDTWMKPL